MIYKHILLIKFVNEPELIFFFIFFFFLPSVKWFQTLLSNSNNFTPVICLHTFCCIATYNYTYTYT